MCSYWLRTWRHTCTLHLHTPFAYAIITKTSYAFFAKITLCIFYPMTPFAHAFAYAIKKTPYAFFAKITLCMYILCGSITCACSACRRYAMYGNDKYCHSLIGAQSYDVTYGIEVEDIYEHHPSPMSF